MNPSSRSIEAARQLAALLDGSAEAIPRADLRSKLERSMQEGRPLRAKLGLDPTAADVTLGWAVVLRKLRRFQDLGHTAVLIVGDFTARVGDPSGKSETRPRLDAEVVRSYARRLLAQFGTILSQERLEIRYNSEWLEPMDMETILRLTAATTVARMLERDDFAKRFAAQRPISVMEFLYPLLQGYDSVAVEADVELGGTDQTFNLLMGRELQREFGQEPQVALTMPLLEGLDGVEKMSKSLGNYVGVEEAPSSMFGKIMSISDDLMWRYYLLCTSVSADGIEQMKRLVADRTLHPKKAKQGLAMRIITDFHGEPAAKEALDEFERVFTSDGVPDDVPEFTIAAVEGKVFVPKLLVECGLAKSNGEAMRVIAQGGVQIEGKRVEPGTREIEAKAGTTLLIKVGKRHFAKAKVS
jgi:tyrosyl-tRNA synthetase